MVLVGDAHGDVICKPQEPVVELTEVPEHERAHATEGVEVVPLPTANAVGLVVVTAGAAAARQDPVRALRARSAVDVVELPTVLVVQLARAEAYGMAGVLPRVHLEVLRPEVDLLQLVERLLFDDADPGDLVWACGSRYM